MDFFIRIVVFLNKRIFLAPKIIFIGYEMILIFFDTDKSN